MINILLADDHKLFRDVLVPALNSQPDMTIVGEATTGREAIELNKELKPDLILLDFGLPKVNGLQAMRSILKDRPKTKVVFLTVFAESNLLIKAIRDGAKGYVIKDTHMSDLLEFIRGVAAGELAVSSNMVNRLNDEYLHWPSSESDD